MEYIFSIYFWIFFSIITIILAIIVFMLSPFVSDSFLHKIGKIWGLLILKISFTEVEYIEKENFEKDEAYIIMPNHQSAFDIFALYAYVPIEFRWVSKEENFKIPVLGWAMRIMGQISVKRGNLKDLKSTIKQMENTLKRGISVLIFPEGTRSEDGKLLPFKKGGFFLAMKTKRKILPVGIIGTKDVMKKSSFIAHPFKKIKLIIGEPIEFKENEKIEERMEKVRKELLLLIENSLDKI